MKKKENEKINLLFFNNGNILKCLRDLIWDLCMILFEHFSLLRCCCNPREQLQVFDHYRFDLRGKRNYSIGLQFIYLLKINFIFTRSSTLLESGDHL